MNQPLTGPGAIRTDGGEVMTRCTMSLSAHALDQNHTPAVRIVMADTLPAGSEMEVTFDPEQAANFASDLYKLAQSALAMDAGIAETEAVAA